MLNGKKANLNRHAQTAKRALPSRDAAASDDRAAAPDQPWQAIEGEVEAMFVRIDRNLETARNHLAAA